MTLAEKIVAALIMKDELIASLKAEVEALRADAQSLQKVRDYFDADVPASVEEKLPDWATPPDPALVPVQIDVPVNL